MIMIWNQKEVFIGHSLHKFNEVCDILTENKIKYKYKIVNHNSKYFGGYRRERTVDYGENNEYLNIYYIYVHKDDYDIASAVLQNY